MEKSAQAFRTISEVAEDLDLPQHVLRFWETRFVQIRPLKRGGGRRYYRPEDIELLRAVRRLLYGEGYTIKGVQKILKEQGARVVAAAYGSAEGEFGALPADVAARPGLDDEAMDSAELPGAMAERESEALQGTAAGVPEAAAPSHGRPTGLGAARPRLPQADLAILRDLLAELSDCARILDAARGS